MTSNLVRPTTSTTCDACKRTIPAGGEVLAVGHPGAVLVFCVQCLHGEAAEAVRETADTRAVALESVDLARRLAAKFRPYLALDGARPAAPAATGETQADLDRLTGADGPAFAEELAAAGVTDAVLASDEGQPWADEGVAALGRDVVAGLAGPVGGAQ